MKTRYLSFAIGAIALLAACGASRPPEEIVSERAQARWDALVSQDYETAWSFHSPGFRAQNSAEVYADEMSRRPIRWDSARVLGVECEEDECAVEVLIGYTAVGAPGPLADVRSERPIKESWIRLDGEWWVSVR